MQNYHEPSQLIDDSRIISLTEILKQSWSLETASPKSKPSWTENNKALGQCAVTALVVNDIFGGDIIHDDPSNHMWNIFPDGSQHDFSREQFLNDISFTEPVVVTRDQILQTEKGKQAQTPERYALLKKRVDTLRLKLGF